MNIKTYMGDRHLASDEYFELLMDLISDIQSLYPMVRTENPYKRISLPTDQRSPQYRWLFDKLVHCLTLLNRLGRVQIKDGAYQSDRGDVMSALDLMQGLLNPQTMLSPMEKQFYKDLYKTYGTEESFNRQQVEETLLYSYTHTNRRLKKLWKTGLITCVEDNRYTGRYYQVV